MVRNQQGLNCVYKIVEPRRSRVHESESEKAEKANLEKKVERKKIR